MKEECLINNYVETRECFYKDERYSVRDNGAVFRYAREGKRLRKYDNKWTFGVPNETTGYMEISGERVHRIVACAFLDNPPTQQYVVDHIDTNRRNNRPENLRWVTRLENALNNPITRARIENICGSIEAFLANPAVLNGHERADPNFNWMRAVSPEEAHASLERLTKWAKDKPALHGRGIGEWVYSPLKKGENRTDDQRKYEREPQILSYENNIEAQPDHLTKSLTPTAMQKNWRTPTEFPLCPSVIKEKPLADYLSNLSKGLTVSRNEYSAHYVDDFALCGGNKLVIRTHADEGLKPYSVITVTFEDGKYIHEASTFFEERGAQKELVLAQGLEWTGGDGIDDYC
jgi:hypothetical protein